MKVKESKNTSDMTLYRKCCHSRVPCASAVLLELMPEVYSQGSFQIQTLAYDCMYVLRMYVQWLIVGSLCQPLRLWK